MSLLGRSGTTLIAVLLLGGCGSGGNSGSGDQPAGSPPTVATTTTTASTGRQISTTFPALSGLYNYSISLDVTVSGASLDVANAQPGKAFLLANGSGAARIENKTSDRNSVLFVTQSDIEMIDFYWSKVEIEQALGSPFACDGYSFSGSDLELCAVGFLVIKIPGDAPLQFGSGESKEFAIGSSVGAPERSFIRALDERVARVVQGWLNEGRPPSLIAFRMDALDDTCTTGGLGGGVVAAFGADGSVSRSGRESGRGRSVDGQAPAC